MSENDPEVVSKRGPEVPKAISRRSWAEFCSSGMLWWINRILHTFGWAIVFAQDEDSGVIKEVYPARVSFRGFDRATDEEGFQRVSAYMENEAAVLVAEAQE